MEVKTVKPVKVFYHAEVTTLNEINNVATKEISNMHSEAAKIGIKEIGPLQFVYYGCDENPETKFTLEIAMTVDEIKPYDGKYKFKDLEEFNCVATIHEGNVSMINETYKKFMPDVFKNGLKIGDQTREVYHKYIDFESPENITEIQIGVN